MDDWALIVIKKVEFRDNQKITGKLNLKYSIDNINKQIQHKPSVKNNNGCFYNQNIKINMRKRTQNILVINVQLKKKYQIYYFGKLELNLNQIRKNNQYEYKEAMHNTQKNVFIQFEIMFLPEDQGKINPRKIYQQFQNSIDEKQKIQKRQVDYSGDKKRPKNICKIKVQKIIPYYSQQSKKNQEQQRDKTPKRLIKRSHQINLCDKQINSQSYKKQIRETNLQTQNKIISNDIDQKLILQSKTFPQQITPEKQKLISDLKQIKQRNPTRDEIFQIQKKINKNIQSQKNKQKKTNIISSQANIIYHNTQTQLKKNEDDLEMTLNNYTKVTDRIIPSQTERNKKNERQKQLKKERQLKKLQLSIKCSNQKNLNMKDLLQVDTYSDDQQSKRKLQLVNSPNNFNQLHLLRKKFWQLSINFEKEMIFFQNPSKVINHKESNLFPLRVFLFSFSAFFLITLLKCIIEI